MSKRFHATPKSVLAVLACLTLLCSLFAFSLTVFADPAEDYAPSRYLKISNTDNAQPQLSLKLPAEQYPVSSGPYTLSVMIKTENVTGDNPNVKSSTVGPIWKVSSVLIQRDMSPVSTRLRPPVMRFELALFSHMVISISRIW